MSIKDLQEHEIATCDGCEARWPAWSIDEEREHEVGCTDPESGSAETFDIDEE